MKTITKRWRVFLAESAIGSSASSLGKDLCAYSPDIIFKGLDKLADSAVDLTPAEEYQRSFQKIFDESMAYVCNIWNNPERFKRVAKNIKARKNIKSIMLKYKSAAIRELTNLQILIGDRTEILDSLDAKERSAVSKGRITNGIGAVFAWRDSNSPDKLFKSPKLIFFTNPKSLNQSLESLSHIMKEELHHFFSTIEEKISTKKGEISVNKKLILKMLDTRLLKKDIASRSLLFMKKSSFMSASSRTKFGGASPEEQRVFRLVGKEYAKGMSPNMALAVLKKVCKFVGGPGLFKSMSRKDSWLYTITNNLHKKIKYIFYDRAEFTHRIQQIRDLACEISNPGDKSCKKDFYFKVTPDILSKVVAKAEKMKLGSSEFILFLRDDLSIAAKLINKTFASNNLEKISKTA